jgi:hypothetical protein
VARPNISVADDDDSCATSIIRRAQSDSVFPPASHVSLARVRRTRQDGNVGAARSELSLMSVRSRRRDLKSATTDRAKKGSVGSSHCLEQGVVRVARRFTER